MMFMWFSWGLTTAQNSIRTTSDLDRFRLADTRSGHFRSQYPSRVSDRCIPNLFTWSVQWLLLLCSVALHHCTEQTLWSRLRCWAQWHWYFTQFKLFYFPNIIGLVQQSVQFVMHTEPKASYRTVQYEYAYRYTPNIYIYIYIYTHTHTYTHIYKKIHTHIYIHIYIHTQLTLNLCLKK